MTTTKKIQIYIGAVLLSLLILSIGLTYIFSKTFEKANDIQQYEVVTDSTTVEIHTQMSIDSVEMLLGKPQKYHTYSVAGSEYHTYQYLFDRKGTNYSIKLEFKDKRLFNVEQP